METIKQTYVQKQITQALIDLLKKQDFDSISVSQLTLHAQVGRASFYRHFKDTRQVLQIYVDHLTNEIHARADKIPEEERMLLLLSHYDDHRDFYLALYQAGLSELLRISIQSTLQLDKQTDNHLAYLIAWYAGATFGWIDEWIKRGMIETPQEMVDHLANFVKKQDK
ncbi:TetR/AcrR family transcriptional regulator [Streptococcus suis]|uniref:TetR/AcrR family transcriptional regulator n=1 Tax=Streptococcus suis TaxID=1307 RepID=UPI0023D7F5AA|nr:TetR/AcrR family transcriptional regulator [Streptococcus suis]